jgi:hypothetical protein
MISKNTKYFLGGHFHQDHNAEGLGIDGVLVEYVDSLSDSTIQEVMSDMRMLASLEIPDTKLARLLLDDWGCYVSFEAYDMTAHQFCKYVADNLERLRVERGKSK